MKPLVHRPIQSELYTAGKDMLKTLPSGGSHFFQVPYRGHMPLMILWDIDHTLIENAGVSKEIYVAAFAAMTGTPPVHEAVTEGRTDRLIMREMFRHHCRAEPAWPIVETALGQAGENHAGDLRRRGVLPVSARHSGRLPRNPTGFPRCLRATSQRTPV